MSLYDAYKIYIPDPTFTFTMRLDVTPMPIKCISMLDSALAYILKLPIRFLYLILPLLIPGFAAHASTTRVRTPLLLDDLPLMRH
ncbi:hypothetical protein P691DRAFT_760919 [Macrolepiota fuliginosa MF-IS2]|uniref:Uncharacterized protein n=1 Tax=Macrolepiota fuliginosa MF-IS2 TaxID=1400762 RepID=A0A9P6C0F2_9AGAR|nr:hypothetical protein P691DRAFT_760919 [Macrolepiota fuliginosa MF-IS2]